MVFVASCDSGGLAIVTKLVSADVAGV